MYIIIFVFKCGLNRSTKLYTQNNESQKLWQTHNIGTLLFYHTT